MKPASFFSARGSKMESQQPGRKDDINPAAGLMVVVKNQTERERLDRPFKEVARDQVKGSQAVPG